MGFREVFAGWPLLAECALVLSCLTIAWRRLHQLRKLAPPETRYLLRELTQDRGTFEGVSQFDDATRRAALAELNQRISDVAFALGVLPATFVALVRICIASGTALALLGFLQDADRPPLIRALQGGACALCGFVGAAFNTAIGRAAKLRAAAIRVTWDRASRQLGEALRASLD